MMPVSGTPVPRLCTHAGNAVQLSGSGGHFRQNLTGRRGHEKSNGNQFRIGASHNHRRTKRVWPADGTDGFPVTAKHLDLPTNGRTLSHGRPGTHAQGGTGHERPERELSDGSELPLFFAKHHAGVDTVSKRQTGQTVMKIGWITA